MRAFYNRDKHKYADMKYEGKYLLDPKYMTKRDLQNYYLYYNITRRRSSQFKKIILITFIICIFLYVIVDYDLSERFDYIHPMNADLNISQAYFINTVGCQMPYFDVINNNILQFMYKPRNYSCKKPLTRINDNPNEIWLNVNETELNDYFNITNLEHIQCEYIQIQRKTDEDNKDLEHVKFHLDFKQPVQVKSGFDLIRVECNKSEQLIYKDVHFFINKNNTHKHNQSINKNDRLSVMIIGLDSLSHLNFLRQMTRTADYIHKQLLHVELWGYNKVEDNTYPNLMPVLSGLDETELNMSCLIPVKQANYDKCAFIWKRYKEHDFSTYFAEDVAELALFNYYNGAGFRKTPTDYYFRPVMLEMEKHIKTMRKINMHLCQGGRKTTLVLMELIHKLIPSFQQEHFFSFFWSVSSTHDYFNVPTLLDDSLVQMFEAFEVANLFNSTVILLMSDHGIRWGSFRETYQGMMEERQPLFIALFPTWFKQKYKSAFNNLQNNARRLATPYDIHETLLDLLYMNENLADRQIAARLQELQDVEMLPRGISLFLPIPETRTCESAGIAAHWCTCHQRLELATNDARVQKAARFIVKLLNERLKPYSQCRTLYLNAIMEANIAAPHHKIVKQIRTDYGMDITLRIQTKPGLGLFESTVRIFGKNILLTGTISRLNLYSSQSFCVNDKAIKMFCYCHR